VRRGAGRSSRRRTPAPAPFVSSFRSPHRFGHNFLAPDRRNRAAVAAYNRGRRPAREKASAWRARNAETAPLPLGLEAAKGARIVRSATACAELAQRYNAHLASYQQQRRAYLAEKRRIIRSRSG